MLVERQHGQMIPNYLQSGSSSYLFIGGTILFAVTPTFSFLLACVLPFNQITSTEAFVTVAYTSRFWDEATTRK